MWIQLTGSRVLDADGRLLYFIAQVQDIDERKRAEQQLRVANAELEGALAELRGYEIQMRRIHELSQLLMVCADRTEAYAVMRRGEPHYYLDPAKDLACGHSARDGQGSVCVPLTVNGRTTALVHVGALGSNESDARRIEALIETLGEVVKTSLSNLDLREHLSEQAIRDRLTGLYNRRHLDEQLPVEFERARRKGQPLCVAMIDIDHFKHFNDDFGHEAGDEVLRAVGRYLRESCRKVDLVFRYGGEEFLLILSEAEAEGARRRLETIREGALGLSIWYAGEKLPTPSLSVGVAFSGPGRETPDPLVRAADQALYRAKALGRNRVEFDGGTGA